MLQRKVVALGGELDRLSVELKHLRLLVPASSTGLQKSSTPRLPADSFVEAAGMPPFLFQARASCSETMVEVLDLPEAPSVAPFLASPANLSVATSPRTGARQEDG